MKYWKQICGISIVIIIVTMGSLFLVMQKDYPENDTVNGDKQNELEDIKSYQVSMIEIQEELYDRLHSFAQVLYEYDTAERKFYEGAEKYMTPQAYGAIYPVSAQENDEQGAIRVRSTLMEIKVYAFYTSVTQADVIMESHFSLTQTPLTQYLRLKLERQEGEWLITECEIIDTLEE